MPKHNIGDVLVIKLRYLRDPNESVVDAKVIGCQDTHYVIEVTTPAMAGLILRSGRDFREFNPSAPIKPFKGR